MRQSVHRFRRRLALLAATGAFVLTGCDPAVRDTVLSGVESATSGLIATFVSAFFEGLNQDTQGTVSTVQAINTSPVEYLA
ncbi:MAG: hypothetical protein CHACPFDD_01586 [Phycisphaerae bacterium]|nr:hypothetical protein [Phycisphaerae bacterium]